MLKTTEPSTIRFKCHELLMPCVELDQEVSNGALRMSSMP